MTNSVHGEVVDVMTCFVMSQTDRTQECSYPPRSFRKLVFSNASAQSIRGGLHQPRSQGAFIKISGKFHPTFNGILIEDCIFENSYAEDQGAIIFADCEDSQSQLTSGLNFVNVLFRNNVANGAGGGALSFKNCKRVKMTGDLRTTEHQVELAVRCCLLQLIWCSIGGC